MKTVQPIFDLSSVKRPFDWGRALLAALAFHALLIASGTWISTSILPSPEKSVDILISSTANATAANQNLEVDLVNLTARAEPTADFQIPVEQPYVIPEPLPDEPLPDPIIPTPAPSTPDPGLLTTDTGRPPTPVLPASLPSPPSIPTPVPLLVNSAEASGTDPADNTVTIGNKNFPKPPYPYAAVAEHMEGTVVLYISIESGKIIKTTVNKSSGYGILDRAAANWVSKNWRFAENITGTVTQPIQFQLN